MSTKISSRLPRSSHAHRVRGNAHFLLQLFCLSTLLLIGVPVHGSVREEVKARSGESISLPCRINRDECGDFHSLKWYKENRRVFVYSPLSDFKKAEGELVDRASLSLDSVGAEEGAHLQLTDLKTSDEGEYKCEITFLDITKDCPVVQLVKLTTLAEPKYLNISLPDGQDGVLASASSDSASSPASIGPYNEGQEVRLLCESGGGKPIPKVTWYNGSSVISGKASSFEEPDGTGTGRNEIRLKLSRGDLGSAFSCRAENEAIEDAPLEAGLEIDVNLRPLSTEIVGNLDPVEEGTTVTLMCRSSGSRPASVITWYNGSTPFAEIASENSALQDDQTYETQSRISFLASRHENGELITCEANNNVLESYQEEPQRASLTLQVKYAPIVTVFPANITVNETDDVTIHCSVDANPIELKSVRWYRDNQLLSTSSNRSKYEGATVDRPSLVIKDAQKEDMGAYSCLLENEVGTGESENLTEVEVFYKPTVVLRMDPPSPVNELDRRNVTLFCDLVDGNPDTLYSVKWFMDGNLLKQLPLCDGGGGGDDDDNLCDIDPSKLLLEHVTKLFNGNYSCQGASEAGWSDVSEERPLQIYYPPGPAFIRKDREEVVKGDSITLTCEVSDPGRPEAQEFIWMRGGHVINHVDTFNWTIDPVTLETEANISCEAVNEVGQGQPDYIAIEVFAPPTFIERLPPYTGAASDAANFSVSCQVECSPLCDLFWLKDGVPIAEDDERFDINSTRMPPNFAKNDFESVASTLRWNIGYWPDAKLDRVSDNANYTCRSTGNLVEREGVSSTTYFRVEYPPENLEVSDLTLTLEEGSSSDKVLCTAEAYPAANYLWKFNGETVATDNVLFFDYGISRQQAGQYECLAQNRHGEAGKITNINVLYKPECNIKQSEDDGYILLTCESRANPKDVTFAWRRTNESITEGISTPDGEEEDAGASSSSSANKGEGRRVSHLRLEPTPASFGTYFCYVNNSMGQGAPCEIDVQGIGLLKTVGNANVIILVAIVSAVIVAMLCICVCIILICRRRGQKPSEKLSAKKAPSLLAAENKPPPRNGGQHSQAPGGNNSSPDSGHPTDESTLPNGGEKCFYENLPFHGMQQQQPPKQAVSPPGADSMDYADADYKDLYDYGPLSYRQASKEAEKKEKSGQA